MTLQVYNLWLVGDTFLEGGAMEAYERFYSLLLESQPLLLFLVIGIGYLFGRLRLGPFQLGIAGVLFVGLAFGAWQPQGRQSLHIAHEVTQVGLILFVYTVGLSSGAGFFSSLRHRGIRMNLCIVAALVVGAAATLSLGLAFGLTPELIAGVYCGSLTNTPALAAVSELVGALNPDRAADPTLGYSITYPYGVLGGLFLFQGLLVLRRRAFEKERHEIASVEAGRRRLVAQNFEITNPALFGVAIGALEVQTRTGVRISRVRHGEEVSVPTKYTLLHQGDVIVGVGEQANIDKAVEFFGSLSSERLEQSRAQIEMRRVLVSDKTLVGRSLESLELDRRYNAQVTRLRRSDVDIAPGPDTVLELGDRLRVVAPRDRMGEVSRYFGDSERHIADLDYTAITLGISAGVLLGMLPIPLPGGEAVSLGFAGGPLVMGLILGKLGRTGRIVWSIPLEANHTLRHIGLLFFLAGVGVSAGSRFFEALSTAGLELFLLGLISTTLTTVAALLLLNSYGRASVIHTLGATSGMQTQPATLARARELTDSDEVYIAYATTYPIAMIGKIVLAQLLVLIGASL